LLDSAIKDSFAVAIITEWDEFVDYDWEYLSSLMVRPIKIFDGRNILNQENIISI
jgi:UDPglucose 6-dehydrogenase